MSIFRLVTALRAVGLSFTIIGDLLVTLGAALRNPNLGRRNEHQAGPTEHVSGSSSSNGAENEKPETRHTE